MLGIIDLNRKKPLVKTDKSWQIYIFICIIVIMSDGNGSNIFYLTSIPKNRLMKKSLLYSYIIGSSSYMIQTLCIVSQSLC